MIQKKDVGHQISQQVRELYQRNLRILRPIVKAVRYCGRPNIALRGHRDDAFSDAVNNGNFIELVPHLAQFDESLRDHLKMEKRNVQYTSKAVKSQLITVIGSMIRDRVTEHRSQEERRFHFLLLQIK